MMRFFGAKILSSFFFVWKWIVASQSNHRVEVVRARVVKRVAINNSVSEWNKLERKERKNNKHSTQTQAHHERMNYKIMNMRPDTEILDATRRHTNQHTAYISSFFSLLFARSCVLINCVLLLWFVCFAAMHSRRDNSRWFCLFSTQSK